MHLPNDSQTPQSPALLLTIDEAARALRLSRVSIYKLIAQGKLPLVKIGVRRAFGQQTCAHLQT